MKGCEELPFSTWHSSVESHPAFLSASGLQPLFTKVLDETVREGVLTATCRKLALQYLADLGDRLDYVLKHKVWFRVV